MASDIEAEEPSSTRISDKGQLFCERYIVHLVATRAAAEAGYGKNVKSQRTIGSKLLKDPLIRARIDELIAERRERCRITTDMVIDRLAEDAFGGKPGAELTDGRRASLRLLGMHLGMFVERREISGPAGAPISIDTINDVLETVYGAGGDGSEESGGQSEP